MPTPQPGVWYIVKCANCHATRLHIVMDANVPLVCPVCGVIEFDQLGVVILAR